MSKFDLRDISDRLTASSDTEAVVYEFIGYLQSVHADWRASLAFYEVSRDVLVNVYERDGNRLMRREVTVAVDQLPPRLVRKFFHPSAFFNQLAPRTPLSHWLRASPCYEPDPVEAPALRPLVALPNWRSCLCVPLTDREDILALLVVASAKKNAFPSKAVTDLLPIKNVAAMALSYHLHRTAVGTDGQADAPGTRTVAAEFQDRIRHLSVQTSELEAENRTKTRKLNALLQEIEGLERNTSEYRQELERVKGTVVALEEQSEMATQHLNDAYTELSLAQSRLSDLERTMEFMGEIFHQLAREHDPAEVSRSMVAWLCERFDAERCSLMLLDPAAETLHVAAHRGMDPEVARQVKVRVGQGVAGWVARNRKPLFVRVREEAPGVPRMEKENYRSDSFVSVPLIYNDRLRGVLNLTNKRDGEPFEDIDLERAMMVGSVLAILLAGLDARRLPAAA